MALAPARLPGEVAVAQVVSIAPMILVPPVWQYQEVQFLSLLVAVAPMMQMAAILILDQ